MAAGPKVGIFITCFASASTVSYSGATCLASASTPITQAVDSGGERDAPVPSSGGESSATSHALKSMRFLTLNSLLTVPFAMLSRPWAMAAVKSAPVNIANP